jgi:hypothetical protein
MRTIPLLLLLVVATGFSGCRDDDSPNTDVNLEPFRALARTSTCADVSNRLFLIDHQLVFWDRQSNCADASYARVLYERTVSDVICDVHDSIAGPQKACHDNDGRYTEMFDTIVDNLDKEDLGLGSAHTVEPIDF